MECCICLCAGVELMTYGPFLQKVDGINAPDYMICKICRVYIDRNLESKVNKLTDQYLILRYQDGQDVLESTTNSKQKYAIKTIYHNIVDEYNILIQNAIIRKQRGWSELFKKWLM